MSSNGAGDEEAGRKMFVGGIHRETQEHTLRAYFEKFGNVKDCILMTDKATGNSRGFGFVTYTDPSGVDAVIKACPHTLDNKKIDPKVCTPRHQQQKRNHSNNQFNKTHKIFVGGLSMEAKEEDVSTYFTRYGVVTEVNLVQDKNDPSRPHKGFGFVTFEDESSVDQAIAKHFHVIKDKRSEVKSAESKDKLKGNQYNQNRMMGGGYNGQKMGGGMGGYNNQNHGMPPMNNNMGGYNGGMNNMGYPNQGYNNPGGYNNNGSFPTAYPQNYAQPCSYNNQGGYNPAGYNNYSNYNQMPQQQGGMPNNGGNMMSGGPDMSGQNQNYNQIPNSNNSQGYNNNMGANQGRGDMGNYQQSSTAYGPMRTDYPANNNNGGSQGQSNGGGTMQGNGGNNYNAPGKAAAQSNQYHPYRRM